MGMLDELWLEVKLSIIEVLYNPMVLSPIWFGVCTLALFWGVSHWIIVSALLVGTYCIWWECTSLLHKFRKPIRKLFLPD